MKQRTRFGPAGTREPSVVFCRLDALPPVGPREDIVGQLLAPQEIGAVVAPPAAGKSTLAARLAACVSAGLPFLGRAVMLGSVAYVAAERAQEVIRRLQAVAAPGAPIYVTRDRPQFADPASIEATVEGLRAVAAEAVERGDPLLRLIIVDTAARCFLDLDENSARDLGLANEGMGRLIEAFPTAALVFLHHPSKGGEGMRGSGALLGAVDIEMSMRVVGDGRVLTVSKANNVPEGQELMFRLVPVTLPCGATVITAAEPAEPGNGDAKAEPRIRGDAKKALDVLHRLETAGPVRFEAWRDATCAAFGKRTPGAKRVAWKKARDTLAAASLIKVADGCVSSVSEA